MFKESNVEEAVTIGYDTARIMEAYGYTPVEIGKMDGTSVLCYGGEEMPESVFVPSYGPRSKRD